MSQALQLTALAVVAALLVRMVPAKEFAQLLPLAACMAITVLVVEFLSPVLDFARELQEATGLEPALLTPLWKVLGITLVCRLGAQICLDAEQKTLAELIQRGGDVLGLYTALPLLRAVLTLLRGLMGG